MEDHAVDGNNNGGEEPCYLLKLPGELRNELFSLALYYPGGVAYDCVSKKLLTQHALALTTTCKQIRRECGNLLFTQNELLLEGQNLGLNALGKHFFANVERRQLIPKFREVHLVLGKREYYNIRLPVPEITQLVDLCCKYNIPMRWSFEAHHFEGARVAYTIPMPDKEEALASLDRREEQIEILEPGIAHGFRCAHERFRASVEDALWLREVILRMHEE